MELGHPPQLRWQALRGDGGCALARSAIIWRLLNLGPRLPLPPRSGRFAGRAMAMAAALLPMTGPPSGSRLPGRLRATMPTWLGRRASAMIRSLALDRPDLSVTALASIIDLCVETVRAALKGTKAQPTVE